jgi:hypothetical protein
MTHPIIPPPRMYLQWVASDTIRIIAFIARRKFLYDLLGFKPWSTNAKKQNSLASSEAKLVPLYRSWLLLSENIIHHTPKNKLFGQEMHLKIWLLSQGLKMSNSKSGYRVSALHILVKYIPSIAFRQYCAHSNKCFIQVLIPETTPGSMLESRSGFMSRSLWTPEKDHQLHL